MAPAKKAKDETASAEVMVSLDTYRQTRDSVGALLLFSLATGNVVAMLNQLVRRRLPWPASTTTPSSSSMPP
ncbi:hypothetical protein K458DRAFT_392267 [Lentithecium fluviatile CBS 122367]|uniref:Uncharacterized protein n=1 Tax=Lentithecium fluviatile CBS 122367 TaxID=1168545 RepID=A0A6G1IS98_9PLEO|nr:hypothetical protein K458DRAFT_392267 [Lentithecium fluviatile CBS 122367]